MTHHVQYLRVSYAAEAAIVSVLCVCAHLCVSAKKMKNVDQKMMKLRANICAMVKHAESLSRWVRFD